VTVPPALRLSLLPPDGSTFSNFYQSGTPHFALSPDGLRIAFIAARAGRQRSLWVRPLESTVAQELPATDDAMSPFWSPDGESLGFFAQGRLKKIGLRDARPETLTIVADGRGGTWSATGVILFGRNAGQLGRIASGGGPVTAVTPPRGDSRLSERWPQFLPDGRHFIFDYRQGAEEMEATYLGELNTTEVTPILEPSATAVYAQGFLLFARAGRLQAQRLDTRSWKVVGQPATVLDQIGYAAGSGHPPVSASSNGLLAYWDGTPVRTELLWLDRQGNVLTSVRQPNIYMGLALSPDGQTVALDRRDPQTSTIEVWLHDSRRTFSRFSFGDGAWPIWARDGRRLVFMKGGALVQRSLGGDEKDREVARLGVRGNFPVDSFPDGRTILLETFGATTAFDLATVTLDDPKPRAILQTAANEVQGRLSPDGKWLAYCSDESGRWEVYVQSFPLTAAKWQISTEGGFQPSWRGDGKELFFVGADLRLMAVSLTTTPAFSSDVPKALFQTRVRPNYEPYPFAYAVTPDGQHFVLNSTELGPGPPISIVTNWSASLLSSAASRSR
jgi:Tol biopolymer transport system component